MLDPYVEKCKKEKFIELRRERLSKDLRQTNDAWTLEELRAMREIAELNIIPDGRFSDSDCCLWSFFREGCA